MQKSQENSGVLVPEVRLILSDVSGVPAAQQISDSLRVGDASEASLDNLLLSENEEAMETGGNDNDPGGDGDGDGPNLDNYD